MCEGWRYYNHAMIPTCFPHKEPNISLINYGLVWKKSNGKNPLLVRWTSNWDCGYDTNWWYIIKDTPFNIELLKSKRRYEINKGNKYFEVRIINPLEEIESIFNVTNNAYSDWPKKYRPIITKKWMIDAIKKWNGSIVLGAYSRYENVLQGYAILEDYKEYVAFSVLRVNPEAEKQGINAAIVANILVRFNDRFQNGFYICDGERSIRHETNFQDYLEKYFGFRKAYCKLNVKYKVWVGLIVKILYPFRNFIKLNSRIGSQISAILKMEEIYRENK